MPRRAAADHVDVRELIPEDTDLDQLRDIAQGCTGCELYKTGTQTVFGEGAHTVDVMLVGEQPGDQEDRQGHPFVGPAGKLLDEALVEAGISGGLSFGALRERRSGSPLRCCSFLGIRPYRTGVRTLKPPPHGEQQR